MYICSDLHTLTQTSWMREPWSLSLYFCPLIGSYFSQIYASSSSLWLGQWPLLCQWATSILLSGTSRLLFLYWSSSNTDTNDHSLLEIILSSLYTLGLLCFVRSFFLSILAKVCFLCLSAYVLQGILCFPQFILYAFILIHPDHCYYIHIFNELSAPTPNPFFLRPYF